MPKKETQKRAQARNQKVLVEGYILMKIQKIQLELSLQLLLMLEQQWLKLKKLGNLLLEKYKYLLLVNRGLK